MDPLQTVTRQRKSTSCLLQYANNNRNQGRFNDVTIQSNDTSIPANRMVLSCYCSFFDQIFVSETNNQVNDLIVDLPDVDGKSLELLIQYIYTGQICISNDNVFNMLSAAHHLELDEVKEFCFEFLESCITTDNCITILITAKLYKNFTLRDKVYKHISDNYETITHTPAFLNLENDELFFIVYHLKTKFYVNDEVLCRSLLSWTKQDEETRKRHFHSRLIKFVNVEHLSHSFVRKLLNENLINEIPDFCSLVTTKIELTENIGSKILSIGGGKSVKVVYSLIDEINDVFPDLPVDLNCHFSIKFKNFVYCGGRSNNDDMLKFFILDLNETDLQWKQMTEMYDNRSAVGSAVFKGNLVVCGGFDGNKWLSSTQLYDVDSNEWNEISSLKKARAGNQSVTSGGRLYTLGGYDGSNYLSRVERLDELDGSWKSVSSMQTPRSDFAAVSCDGVIYAIGGRKGFQALKSVEKFNFSTNCWSNVSEMNIERRGHSACILGSKIFVVGGKNYKGFEDQPVKEIECYNPITDRWEIVAKTDDELLRHSLVIL